MDNGPGLHSLLLGPQCELGAGFDPTVMGGSVLVHAKGYREGSIRLNGLPYEEAGDSRLSPAVLKLVPYHQWGNREPGGEMRVWLRSKE